MDELVRRGHPVKKIDDYTDQVGQSGMVVIDPITNVKFAGADPRGEGAALGY
jgi:gamma-glutamyltranspeptidase/glutathione hydrolase